MMMDDEFWELMSVGVCVVIYSHVYVYMDVRLRRHHPLYVTTACEDLLICTRKGGNPVSLKHII